MCALNPPIIYQLPVYQYRTNSPCRHQSLCLKIPIKHNLICRMNTISTWVIVKSTSQSDHMHVYHKSIGFIATIKELYYQEMYTKTNNRHTFPCFKYSYKSRGMRFIACRCYF